MTEIEMAWNHWPTGANSIIMGPLVARANICNLQYIHLVNRQLLCHNTIKGEDCMNADI